MPSIRENLAATAGTLPAVGLFPGFLSQTFSYPHQYHDYEGFTFVCGGSTYYEFPILAGGGLYSGGSPGPDRVVFEYVIPPLSAVPSGLIPSQPATLALFAVALPTPGLRATPSRSALEELTIKVIGYYVSGKPHG